MMRRILTAGCAAVVVAGAGLAQEKSGAEKKAVTPEAFLELRSVQEPQFSPDGTKVAFVVDGFGSGEKRTRHIWIYEKEKNASRQLTYSTKSESAPRWSPGGKQLLFLSNRDGDEQQIYILRMEGGEAAQLTKGKASASEPAWSPDGKSIAYLAPDPKTEAEEKKEKDKDDERVVDRDDKHARLRVIDVATQAGAHADGADVEGGRTGLDAGWPEHRGEGHGSSRGGPVHGPFVCGERAGREGERVAGAARSVWKHPRFAGRQRNRLYWLPRRWAAATRSDDSAERELR